ncbi:hypothetical protein RRG08_035078 [Elysia crispata]|uniref:Uncharacterized protein n=1 Tax=Elysia crispata TaxID=231223 RepID=A0AAE0ZS94_9GAST|nr:hypothetical protein RRG08_035078 [Elysia crispata]
MDSCANLSVANIDGAVADKDLRSLQTDVKSVLAEPSATKENATTAYLGVTDLNSSFIRHFDEVSDDVVSLKLETAGKFDKLTFNDIVGAASEDTHFYKYTVHYRVPSSFTHYGRKSQVTSLSKEVSTLESAVDALDNDIAFIAEQFASVMTDTGSLKGKFNSVSNDVSVIQKDVSSNHRQIISLRSDVASLQASSSSAGQVVDDLEPSVITLNGNMSSIMRGVSPISKDFLPRKEKVTSFQTNLSSIQGRWNSLNSRLSSLQAGRFCQRQRQLIVQPSERPQHQADFARKIARCYQK